MALLACQIDAEWSKPAELGGLLRSAQIYKELQDVSG